jgi:cobalamin biosynthesis Mg chelatase CobN
MVRPLVFDEQSGRVGVGAGPTSVFGRGCQDVRTKEAVGMSIWLIILIIVVVVVLAGGGWGITRRRR